MGKWAWVGQTKDGQKVTGEDEAKSREEIKKILRLKGIKPIRLREPSVFDLDIGMWLVDKGIASPFGSKELINFTKQMGVMISSGVPLLQSLEILYKQEKNLVLRNIIRKVAAEVASGKGLSESLREQNGFSSIYCNLISAGESTGALDKILDKLSMFLEKVEKIKSQIRSALTYPAIVIIVGTLVIYLLLIFVVPKFTEMLTDSGQKIPDITQFVIDASKWLQEWSLVTMIVTIFLGIVTLSWFKTPEGKPVYDQITMKMPIFGTVVIKGNLAQFSRTLSTMLSSGIALIDSLDICISTVENSVMQKDLRKVKMAIESGKTLADPIEKIAYFPNMVAQMIRVGEQTGNLDQMLDKISEIFEKEVEESIGIAIKLIEPLILVFLGGLVGFILVAMYLPMFMAAGGPG